VPVAILDVGFGHAIGIVFYFLGLVVTLVAQVAMGRSWRIGVDESERTELITTGPFALVRNPIFSAMFLAFLGLVLLAPKSVTHWTLPPATGPFLQFPSSKSGTT